MERSQLELAIKEGLSWWIPLCRGLGPSFRSSAILARRGAFAILIRVWWRSFFSDCSGELRKWPSWYVGRPFIGRISKSRWGLRETIRPPTDRSAQPPNSSNGGLSTSSHASDSLANQDFADLLGGPQEPWNWSRDYGIGFLFSRIAVHFAAKGRGSPNPG
jgi:hypothetical protein